VHLRIPEWCDDPDLKINDRLVSDPARNKGYFVLEREWKTGDRLELDLPMPPRQVAAHPLVRTNHGRLALQRGPVVYCLEAVDNGGGVFDLAIPRGAELETEFKPDLLGGIVTIKAEGLAAPRRDWKNKLYQTALPGGEPRTITAIPYYAWDHRDPGEMVVWIPETIGLAHRLETERKH
jgi:uncharacterized protein